MTGPRQAADTSSTAQRVDGRVERGTRKTSFPVANQWVVLHRVGPDRSGPLDSVRTDANGRFHIRYHTSGDSTALYFVSTSYGGVVYFSSPLRSAVVSGDDGLITVFDTTSGAVAVKIGGRHLIIGAPQASGLRPIGEVYDLKNDSTVTLIARDSVTPVWTTHIPTASVGFQLNASGDLAAGAIGKSGSSVALFAPISPGIRQVAFTYDLPASSFPLSIPVERQTGVLELLVQEPSAKIAGIRLREMAPVSEDGRVFRRFIGQDVPASTVITIDVPRIIGSGREKVYIAVGIAVLAAMVLALVFAGRRARPRRAPIVAPPVETRAESLIRAIADLDAEFERAGSSSPEARRAYEARRALLKAELASVLEAEAARV